MFWLAKPISKPWTAARGCSVECPTSGRVFTPGERVVEVYYYDRLATASDSFRLREDLGVFCIPTSMLRAGVEPRIKLTPQSARPERAALNCGVSAGATVTNTTL